MSEELKVGDVVILKSGSVKMTIEEIDEDNVFCVWFEGTQPQRGDFPAITLMKFVPPKAGIKSI